MEILAIGSGKRLNKIIDVMIQENIAVNPSPSQSAKDLIKLAKEKYPVSIWYTGKIEDMDVLEKKCDIRCSSVYMNGTGTYSIRYRP